MKPQACVYPARVARPFRLCPVLSGESADKTGPADGWRFSFRRAVALAMAALLLPLAQIEVFAQQAQGWPQYGQYPQIQYPQAQYPQNQYPQGEYAPNQQPDYGPPAYPQPNYAQPENAQPGYAQPTQPGAPYADASPEYPQPAYGPGQPLPQSFAAVQLEEMLAPIALYPDALLAQVLAAATYPDQVSVADQWLRSQGYASADQIAAAVDAQNWDPSVKALTAFPQVLAQMDHDLAWTTDLGNAYYNQPQDVLQTVQVLRQRAQAAGTLQNTPQEALNYDQGNIELAPPNPQMVYVPSYNPWDAYGAPVQPYPGFSLLGALDSFAGSGLVQFGVGIAMAAFMHTGFGWMSWALDWLGDGILFHHSAYSSQSTTVAHWGSRRGGASWGGRTGQYGGYERARLSQSRGNYGGQVNRNYGNGSAGGREALRSQESYSGNRPYMGSEYAGNPSRTYPMRPNSYVRPAFQDYGYNRQLGRPQAAMPARQQAYSPQSYARPGYGSSYYGGTSQAYDGRMGGYGSPQRGWRAPAVPAQHGGFEQRAYVAPGGRGFMGSEARPRRSGGLHMFGGGHGSERAFGGGKAPKSFSGGKHSGGGGHSGGHGGGGHRR